MNDSSNPTTGLKFNILSTTLAKEIGILSRVVSSNPTMPILSNLLFEITPTQTTITASDLQTSAVLTLFLEATGEGKIAIPATILIETLRTLPKQPIEVIIDTTNYSATLKTKNGSYRIACENAADFPIVSKPSHQKLITMEVKTLKKAIRQTSFAAGKDEMRPALEGVNLTIDSQESTFAATNGHHLASYKRKDTTSTVEHRLTLGTKPLQVLTQILPDSDEKVNLVIDDQKVFFWIGALQVITSAIDEPYPDYEMIIPKNNPHRLTISTETLRNAVKTIAYYANKSTYQVLLNADNDSLELKAEDFQFANQAQTKLSCSYQGPQVRLGLNASLLLDILNHMSSQEVELHIEDGYSPILITPTDAKDANEELLMLIMPVDLNEKS